MATLNQEERSLGSVLSTGVLATIAVLVIAAACIAPFDQQFFMDWVGTAFMAATPTQIVLGLLWHNLKPDVIGNLRQPIKGLAFTALTVVAGALVLGLVLMIVGKGHAPNPMIIQYFIMSIVVIIWLIPIWQCWPMTTISKDPVVFGVATLILAYFLAYILWTAFFDYSVLGEVGHPHYYSDLDPKGLFDMWTAAIFFVTTAGLIIVHFMFDLWPIEKLTPGMNPPLRGSIATCYILILAWATQTLFIEVLGMQPVEYMIRVPVCMIFGTFLVSNMMQFALFTGYAQPLRGLFLSVCAAVVAVLMYEVYGMAAELHAGHPLGMGPANGFAKELWIATAMLGVTFPIIFVVSGFFAFWPLVRNQS